MIGQNHSNYVKGFSGLNRSVGRKMAICVYAIRSHLTHRLKRRHVWMDGRVTSRNLMPI